MIEFQWLWVFWLIPLPLLALLLPRARVEEAALKVPFFASVKNLGAEDTSLTSKQWPRRLAMILVWLALILSASRPQYIGEPIKLPATGRDLMLAVDISGSMGTEDMNLNGKAVTRLQVVKEVVGDFVERRKGDRLGLILFGSQAYMQTPLTFDRNTVRTLLEETPLGIAGGKTAIGDAIGLAVKKLHDRPADSRVLVLLTDGQNNIGEVTPEQASQIAAQEGVTIYTIGFGADELVVPGLLFNRTINPSSELDSKTLTQIAELTGGIYQRARNSSELAGVYEALDELEPIDQDQETYRPIKALFYYPLALAVVLSLILTLTHGQVIVWFKQLASSKNPRTGEEATV